MRKKLFLSLIAVGCIIAPPAAKAQVGFGVYWSPPGQLPNVGFAPPYININVPLSGGSQPSSAASTPRSFGTLPPASIRGMVCNYIGNSGYCIGGNNKEGFITTTRKVPWLPVCLSGDIFSTEARTGCITLCADGGLATVASGHAGLCLTPADGTVSATIGGGIGVGVSLVDPLRFSKVPEVEVNIPLLRSQTISDLFGKKKKSLP